MTKRQLMDEITNFIEYYTSEETERQQMGDALIDYMLDVHEEPKKVVKFSRGEQLVGVVPDGMVQFTIPNTPSAIERYTKQFLALKYEIVVC